MQISAEQQFPAARVPDTLPYGRIQPGAFAGDGRPQGTQADPNHQGTAGGASCAGIGFLHECCAGQCGAQGPTRLVFPGVQGIGHNSNYINVSYLVVRSGVQAPSISKIVTLP